MFRSIYTRLFAVIVIMVTCFCLMGSYLQGPVSFGSPGSPNPATFSCANDGTTGTANGQVAALSAANTCIKAAAGRQTPVIGIVVSGGGTTGNALVALSGIVPCTFDNTTTFAHQVIVSGSTAGNCNDSGSSAANLGPQSSIGIVLDSGAAGSHNVLLTNLGWGRLGNLYMFGNTNLLNNGTGILQFTGNTTECFQFNGSAGQPALYQVGTLLRVATSTCATSADGNLGTGHLASTNASPPTISSGFGTSPSIVSGGDLAFEVNVGTGTPGTSGVVAFGTAFTTAPACLTQDITTNAAGADSKANATTSQVTLTARSGWTASDILVVHCIGQNGL